MIDKIKTEDQYNKVMSQIEKLVAKATAGGGFSSLNKKDKAELQRLTLQAECFENEELKIMPLPITINSIVTQKMDEMDITQNKLAEILGLHVAKLSQILNGKRKPDVNFLKAVHDKLGVDGNLILERI